MTAFRSWTTFGTDAPDAELVGHLQASGHLMNKGVPLAQITSVEEKVASFVHCLPQLRDTLRRLSPEQLDVVKFLLPPGLVSAIVNGEVLSTDQQFVDLVTNLFMLCVQDQRDRSPRFYDSFETLVRGTVVKRLRSLNI